MREGGFERALLVPAQAGWSVSGSGRGLTPPVEALGRGLVSRSSLSRRKYNARSSLLNSERNAAPTDGLSRMISAMVSLLVVMAAAFPSDCMGSSVRSKVYRPR